MVGSLMNDIPSLASSAGNVKVTHEPLVLQSAMLYIDSNTCIAINMFFNNGFLAVLMMDTQILELLRGFSGERAASQWRVPLYSGRHTISLILYHGEASLDSIEVIEDDPICSGGEYSLAFDFMLQEYSFLHTYKHIHFYMLSLPIPIMVKMQLIL